MFRTTLPLMAIGNPQKLEATDFEKIKQFLSDNPEIVLVLSAKRLLIFGLTSELKVRKSIWKSVEDFERDFTVKVSLHDQTSVFWIARVNSDDAELLDRVAAEVCVLNLHAPEARQSQAMTEPASDNSKKVPETKEKKIKKRSTPPATASQKQPSSSREKTPRAPATPPTKKRQKVTR